MRTELLEQEKNIVKVRVEFEVEEFSSGLAKVVSELARQISIPGFRKGHAPRRALEMRLGRNALYTETIEKLLPDCVPQIVEDYELEVISRPTVELDDVVEGQPVFCEITFEVLPEVKLPDLGTMEIERLRTAVSDEDADALFRHVMKENSTIMPADRPVQDGDLVAMTATVHVIEEGAEESEPQAGRIDLNEPNLRPEIRAAVLGLSKGDRAEAEFDVEPANPNRSTAGKRIHYSLTVDGVFEYVSPELNEEFFKAIFGGDTDILTEEAFRRRLKDNLWEFLETEHSADARMRALSAIARESEIDVPQMLVENQAAKLRQADEEEAKERYGRELKDVLGTDDADWESNYAAVLDLKAEAIVRQSLVLGALVKKYDVVAEKEDMDAELDRRSRLRNIKKDELVSYFYKNDDARGQLIEDLKARKALEMALGEMQVKEVDQLSKPKEPEPAEAGAKEGESQAPEPGEGQNGEPEGEA